MNSGRQKREMHLILESSSGKNVKQANKKTIIHKKACLSKTLLRFLMNTRTVIKVEGLQTCSKMQYHLSQISRAQSYMLLCVALMKMTLVSRNSLLLATDLV